MAGMAWLWAGALACVVGGCAGKASDDNTRAASGHAGVPGTAQEPNLPSSAGAPSAPSNAGEPDAAADAGSSVSCVGTLKEAADALGFSCPNEFCAANILGSDCGALPTDTIKTGSKYCVYDRTNRLSFQISASRRKECYYQASDPFNGSNSALVGAKAWDDQGGFCGGAATQISGGQISEHCTDEVESTLCDLDHPEQNPANDGTPARACFNKNGNSCEPCCPATPPDCTGKPDYYPGYECTPAPVSFASCSCHQEQWGCGG